MNDHHNEDVTQPEQNNHHNEDVTQNEHSHELNADRMLEARISHVLQNQAAHIHFTRDLHNQILRNLPRHRPLARQRLLAPALALAALLLVVFSLGAYLLLNQQPSLQYTLSQVIQVPAELAHGGQLLSLDPTGQHLVYQPANQPGVMYTVDIHNPLSSNILAMRYAHSVGWSPDGTELVTTVSPTGVTSPLLALVKVGDYMKPLGPQAEAASWSPTSTQQILYITQAHNRTRLWSTPSAGGSSQLVATMNIALPVQQIAWSHDGQKLALLTTEKSGSALYIMDVQTHTLQTIVKAGTMSIATIDWSPAKHYLTYEQSNTRGNVTLRAVDVDQQKALFALTTQKNLTGWSWSPASNAIVYSDGGTLHTYALHGASPQLPHLNDAQYPFWLKDGRILSMNIIHGEGEIAILTKSTK